MTDYLKPIEEEAEKSAKEDEAERGRQVCPADWQRCSATAADEHGGYSIVDDTTGKVVDSFPNARLAHALLFSASAYIREEIKAILDRMITVKRTP